MDLEKSSWSSSPRSITSFPTHAQLRQSIKISSRLAIDLERKSARADAHHRPGAEMNVSVLNYSEEWSLNNVFFLANFQLFLINERLLSLFLLDYFCPLALVKSVWCSNCKLR